MDLVIGSGLLSSNKYTDTREMRSEILNKYNHTCNYCNIKYDKYLYCIYQDEKYILACSLCYSVLNPNHNNNMIVVLSKINQLDIIKQTVKFIESDGRAPRYYEIDPDSKLVDISMFEFCNLIIKHKDNRDVIQGYKLFITDNTNINHINSNLFYTRPVIEHQDVTPVSIDKKLFM